MVRRPSQRARSGQEALLVGQQGSGGPAKVLAEVARPSGGPGGVERPSWRIGSGRKTLTEIR